MTEATRKPSLFRQAWQAILQVSEVAAAIHYAAPWDVPAPKRQHGTAREISPSMMRTASCA